MNRFAYYFSGYALKAFSSFSKARIIVHHPEIIPEGSLIFTANHFTRIETIFLPYHIHALIKKPVWSMASSTLFQGAMKNILESMGAVSTKSPDRDLLIIKSLISAEAAWIIYPEGMMVKNKKLVNHDQFQLSDGNEVQRPHTGAATLALRNEFYRERLKRMKEKNPDEFQRLVDVFEITDLDKVFNQQTYIVPVNITYYPVRARENILSNIALNMMENPSPRVMEELMTEGTMLFSGVDVDIRFGDPIEIKPYLNDSFVESDLSSRRKIEFNDRISSIHVMKSNALDIMDRYMTSVYEMTTLNYDHIFASILEHFPLENGPIDSYDFRCRAYLAVTGRVLASDRYLHKSFNDNQIHLLTDDKYNRYEDFIQVAATTGVVELKNGTIIKNQAAFNSPYDFHQIRIENPLAVITNEVEPLTEIQDLLKELAEKHPDEIQARVKQRICEKIRLDYDRDYNRYSIQDESKPKDRGEPFLLVSEKNRGGVLLIHGYMASPAEMKPFADYLHGLGYTVYVPRLKGHGTAPEDLAQTSYHQWIESVEEGYVILRHSTDRIVLGGFSTGAGLALYLQTRVDGIQAVFAVAPPMKLNDFGSYFVPAVTIWNQMMKKASLTKISKEFVKNSPENPHINYLRNPVAGVRQLEKFMEDLESRLSQVDVPVLVVQSRKDPVVSPKGTEKLFKEIGSEKKEYFLFDIDRHGIMIGNDVDRVYKAISDFIEAELGSAQNPL